MTNSTENKQIAIFAVVVYSILSSAMAPVTKVGLLEIPPFTFTLLRFFIASILVLPFVIGRRLPTGKKLLSLVLFSMFASANIVFFVLGISRTTANASQIIYAGVPVLIIILLKFFWGKSIKKNEVTGVVLGFVGVSVVVLAPLFSKNGVTTGDLYGNILLVIAIFFISLYIIISKNLQKDYSPFLIISAFIFVTTIVLIPFFLWELWQGKLISITFNFHGILSLIYVIAVGTIGTYLLNQYSIKHGGVVLASLIFYLSPLFGFLIAFILLGESLSFSMIIGAILTLIGIFLTTKK